MRSEFQNLYNQLDPHDPALIALLTSLIPESLQEQWSQKPDDGCPQEFVDSLVRVNSKKVGKQELCAICFENFHDDEYPLIVKLPHCNHMFDLQCIAVWLGSNKTCPVCRDDVLHKSNKLDDVDTSQAELQDDWGMYG